MPTLDWIGKKAVLNHHREVSYRLLKCDSKLSVGDPGSGNLLVEGDNLLALKALLPYYAGQVKCIYIDPPYNTGNENWVYNDAVNSPEIRAWLGKVVGREAEDLSRHDKWLCMMYPRLALLRDMLREDGAIFVSIDDNEVQNLRALLDEIFGSRNFVASFIWQKRRSPDNDETFSTPVHDYILSYARDKSQRRFNRLRRTEEADARYSNPDNDPRGPWTSSDLTRREYREHDFYPITLPSGRQVRPAAGRSWSVPPESFEGFRHDNRIWFGPTGDSMPRRKRFLSEVSEGIVPTTW
jgi:adenine-specific DNA-methyltransferase